MVQFKAKSGIITAFIHLSWVVMRNYLKGLIPTPAAIKENPAFHFLGDLLHDPNLFHLNRHSVSVAMFWGLFIALLPIPGQMPLAAGAALLFRCNLPIAVALTWVSNPLTMAFFIFINYAVGRFCLQLEPYVFTPPSDFTLNWVIHEVPKLWHPFALPFLLGCILNGVLLGALGYFTLRAYWRWHVRCLWQKRKLQRARDRAGSAKKSE